MVSPCILSLYSCLKNGEPKTDPRSQSKIHFLFLSTQTSPIIQNSTLFPESHGNKSQPWVACLRWENLDQPHRISHNSALRESIWWLPVLFGDCVSNRKRARPGELLREGAWEKCRGNLPSSVWGLDGNMLISEGTDRKSSWVRTDTIPSFLDTKALHKNTRFMAKPLE